MSSTTSDVNDWTRSDIYHNSFLIPPDATLDSALKLSEQNGLPPIQAHRILEVGTLGGYSTIWFAKALPPDGEIITCEISEHYAKVAQQNIDHAGLTSRVKIVLGPAIDTLSRLHSDETFDLAFIDADKQSNVDYFIQAKRLVRNQGVIIVDNVVRSGRVADPIQSDPSVDGVRRLLQYIHNDSTVEATTMGTVGEKGYDGFLFAINKPR
ncbi:unnamed protein product [Adineta ricciae]|uniref:Uncharacterized protein n=1 Tax=Adineta ricciae TaxID=249248 RepID=A0A815HC08_ADIRI|nr:unnamed protein product [Adineta ricciae]